MRKSFVLVLTAAGVGATYAQGVTSVSRDSAVPDPSTWRWRVSSILDNQQISASESATIGSSRTGAFDQGYQRYSTFGLPQRASGRSP